MWSSREDSSKQYFRKVDNFSLPDGPHSIYKMYISTFYEHIIYFFIFFSLTICDLMSKQAKTLDSHSKKQCYLFVENPFWIIFFKTALI